MKEIIKLMLSKSKTKADLLNLWWDIGIEVNRIVYKKKKRKSWRRKNKSKKAR